MSTRDRDRDRRLGILAAILFGAAFWAAVVWRLT